VVEVGMYGGREGLYCELSDGWTGRHAQRGNAVLKLSVAGVSTICQSWLCVLSVGGVVLHCFAHNLYSCVQQKLFEKKK